MALRRLLGGEWHHIDFPTAFLVDAVLQTGRGIRRAKGTYCIGLSSCVLVVVVSAVVQTLLARAPLIFLREAEAGAGQIDITLLPGAYSGTDYLNYTSLAAALAGGPSPASFAYHAPRHAFVVDAAYPTAACLNAAGGGGSASASSVAPVGWRAGVDSNAWMYGGPPNSTAQNGNSYPRGGGGGAASYGGRRACGTGACITCTRRSGITQLTLLLIDTGREAAAGIGRAWPLSPIPAGAIVLHAAAAGALGVGPGDSLLLRNTGWGPLIRHALAPAPALPGAGWVPAGSALPLNGSDAAAGTAGGGGGGERGGWEWLKWMVLLLCNTF